MCRKTPQVMVFAHFSNPTWFFIHEIRPIWRSHRPPRQAGGNHLFTDGGPLDPAKQILADFLDSRATAFSLCPLMLQKSTVR